MIGQPNTFPDSPMIGVIGGLGRVGQKIVSVLEEAGHHVQISDIDTPLSNVDIAGKSDIIFISVPIDVVSDVAQEIGPLLKKRQIVIHVCSVVEGPLRALKANNPSGASIYYAHPMCDPNNWLDLPQTVVTSSEALADERLNFLWEDLFEGFRIVEAAAQKHDEMSSLVQAVHQLMATTMSATFTAMNINPDRLFNYQQHPKFSLQMAFNKRLLSQDPQLFANIIFGSEAAKKNTALFLDHLERLTSLNAQNFFKDWAQAKKFFESEHKLANENISQIRNAIPLPMFVAPPPPSHEINELPSSLQTTLALAVANLLMDKGVKIKELRQFSSPSYDIHVNLFASILNEEGMLVVSRYSLEYFERFIDITRNILTEGRSSYLRHFYEAQRHFGSNHCHQLRAVTDGVIAFHKQHSLDSQQGGNIS